MKYGPYRVRSERDDYVDVRYVRGAMPEPGQTIRVEVFEPLGVNLVEDAVVVEVIARAGGMSRIRFDREAAHTAVCEVRECRRCDRRAFALARREVALAEEQRRLRGERESVEREREMIERRRWDVSEEIRKPG